MSKFQCVMSISSQMKNSNHAKFIKTIESIVENSDFQIEKKNGFDVLLDKNSS